MHLCGVKAIFCAGLLLLALLLPRRGNTQSPALKLSPRDTLVSPRADIAYARPSVRGRTIFGALVPYDKMWRTGANRGTELTLKAAAKVNGITLPAGTYTLFTIPGVNEWTVILNTDIDQFDTAFYEPTHDVARFTVRPEPIPQSVELLTFRMEGEPPEERLVMEWERTRISILLEFAP